MVRVVVDNRIRLSSGAIDPVVAQRICARFSHANPKHARLRRMGFYPGASEPRVIDTWAKEGDELSFARGGMRRIREELRRAGIPFEVEDRRCSGTWHKASPLEEELRLYDYQERCVDQALAAEQGIIRCPTGSGKTTMVLALASRVGLPSLVAVHTKGLARQWMQRAEKELGFTPGMIGDGQFNPKYLTVALAQSLYRIRPDRWEKLAPMFGAVFADEVHLFGAATFMQALDRFPARYRIGTSADERRTDRKDFLLKDLFGSVVAEVEESELVDREFVHAVELVCEPTEFRADWYVESRQPDEETGDPAKVRPSDYSKLVDELSADSARNRKIVELVARLSQAGHRVIVWTGRIEHARSLLEAIETEGQPCALMLGGNSTEFETSRSRFLEGSARVVLGTYQSIGTGIDLPLADRGVAAAPFATRQVCKQVTGRLSRRADNKTDARAHYMWDELVFGDGPVKRMRAWNSRCYVARFGSEVEAKEFLKSWKKQFAA